MRSAGLVAVVLGAVFSVSGVGGAVQVNLGGASFSGSAGILLILVGLMVLWLNEVSARRERLDEESNETTYNRTAHYETGSLG